MLNNFPFLYHHHPEKAKSEIIKEMIRFGKPIYVADLLEAFGYRREFKPTSYVFERCLEELIEQGRVLIDKPAEYGNYVLHIFDRIRPSYRELAKQAQGEAYG